MRVAASGLLAVVAMVALACYTGAGAEKVDPAAFSWNAPVSAPATVFLRNMNGSVEVKPATGGNVSVTAEVRWKRGDPKRDLRFETVNGPNGPTICALWGGGTCSASGYNTTGSSLSSRLLGHSTDANVSFTVYVPAGVKIDASTMNGSIGVAATAPVMARSMNGTIKVATSVGPVDAETVNGDVDVRMTTLGADGPVRARSVNGSVSAYLPEKFDGSVEMATVLGSITSDFAGGALTDGGKKLSAALGTGGRKVDIGTVTGSAALHKLKADGTVAAP
ncbi:MAG: DUF4097 family beta strand repeat-containing protein [Gemmatimonadales bacterium]